MKKKKRKKKKRKRIHQSGNEAIRRVPYPDPNMKVIPKQCPKVSPTLFLTFLFTIKVIPKDKK